ncbi:MAG: hypothetical protein AB2A00_35695 [Myxococcota bacterium]
MDDVKKALAEGDWARAAELHTRAGEHRQAAQLHERMLDFTAAAEAWLRAGDGPACLRCAVRGGERTVQTRMLASVLVMASVEDLTRAARLMTEMGRPELAAPLHEGTGDLESAAQALEAAGDLAGAARRWLQVGNHRTAGQLLERHLQTAPNDRHAMLELGGVLARFGRHDAATPMLRTAAEAPELAEQALRQLALSFLSQGHPHAAELVLSQLQAISTSAPADVVALGRLVERNEPRVGEGHARIASRYLLLAPRAASSLGDAYTAYDELEDRRVVVTLFRPAVVQSEALRRFARVARAAASLEVAGLLRLVELNLGGGFMVSAVPRGPALEEWLEEGRTPPADVTLRGAGEVLVALHRRGLCHGALNLTNLHVSDGGEVEVAEAGAGLLAPLRETESAGLQASLAMLAPELMAGAEPGAPADQYALAAVAYRLATGALPQPSGTPMWRPPSSVRAQAAALDATLARALAARPQDRFESISAFLSALPSVLPAPVSTEKTPDGPAPQERYALSDEEVVAGGMAWRHARDRLLGRGVMMGQVRTGDVTPLRLLASPAFGTDPILELDVVRRRCVVAAAEAGPLPRRGELAHALLDVADALEALHRGGFMLGAGREARLPTRGPVRLRLAGLPLPVPADPAGVTSDVALLAARVADWLELPAARGGRTLAELRTVIASAPDPGVAPMDGAVREEWDRVRQALVESGPGNPHT